MAPLSWTRPNGAIEELPEDPEWEFPRTRYPEANTKPMVPATFISMFTSDQWFLDEGRHLTRYEVVFIMRLVFFGDDYLMYIKTFEYFANPDYFLTVACQSINESSKYAWISKVEKWLVELRGLPKDSKLGQEAREIQSTLKGFTGRLPDLPILEKDRPKVKNHRTREDQFFLIHALLSFCRDSKGNKLDDSMARTVYYKYFGIGFSGGIIPIFKILADPNHRLTIIVARSMADHKLENFFGNKAHEMLKEMDPKATLKLPSDDILRVTHAMGVSSLGATAPASNQPPGHPFSRLTFPYNVLPADNPRRMEEERRLEKQRQEGLDEDEVKRVQEAREEERKANERKANERKAKEEKEAKEKEEKERRAHERKAKEEKEAKEKKEKDRKTKTKDDGKGMGEEKRKDKRQRSPDDRERPPRGRPWEIR